MNKKKYTVKEYSVLKGIPMSTIYKQINENRISFERLFNRFIIIED